MNTKAIPLAALAAISGVASGQGVRIEFRTPYSSVTGAAPVDWSVWASFTGYDDPTAYFGGFDGMFVPQHFGRGWVVGFENLLSHGEEPDLVADSVQGLRIFNSAADGTDDPSNPIEIARFSVTHDLFGLQAYTALGSVWVYPDDGVLTPPDELVDFEVRTDWVYVGGGGSQEWGCAPADQSEPYGVLDLDDVREFVLRFLAGEEGADLAPAWGVLDAADVSAFVESFIAGCIFP